MGGDEYDNDALCANDKRSDLSGKTMRTKMSCASGRGPLGAASSLQSDFPPLPTRGGYCRKNCPFSTIHGLSAASLALYYLLCTYCTKPNCPSHIISAWGFRCLYPHCLVCPAHYTALVLSEKQPLCVLHPTTTVWKAATTYFTQLATSYKNCPPAHHSGPTEPKQAENYFGWERDLEN